MLIVRKKGQEIAGISRVAMHKMLNKVPRPEFFIDVDGDVMIDDGHPSWIAYMEKRKLKAAKKDQFQEWSESSREEIAGAVEEIPVPSFADDIGQLAEDAAKAQMREAVAKANLTEHKSEITKLQLEKDAGNVMELGFAEFVFFGYMERLNLQLCNLDRKLKSPIADLVQAGDSAGIVRLINREITNILKAVKESQKKDLMQWKKENLK